MEKLIVSLEGNTSMQKRCLMLETSMKNIERINFFIRVNASVGLLSILLIIGITTLGINTFTFYGFYLGWFVFGAASCACGGCVWNVTKHHNARADAISGLVFTLSSAYFEDALSTLKHSAYGRDRGLAEKISTITGVKTW